MPAQLASQSAKALPARIRAAGLALLLEREYQGFVAPPGFD